MVARRVGGRVWPDSLLHPASIVAFDYLVARSWVGHRRGTLTWKGRAPPGPQGTPQVTRGRCSRRRTHIGNSAVGDDLKGLQRRVGGVPHLGAVRHDGVASPSTAAAVIRSPGASTGMPGG